MIAWNYHNLSQFPHFLKSILVTDKTNIRYTTHQPSLPQHLVIIDFLIVVAFATVFAMGFVITKNKTLIGQVERVVGAEGFKHEKCTFNILYDVVCIASFNLKIQGKQPTSCQTQHHGLLGSCLVSG